MSQSSQYGSPVLVSGKTVNSLERSELTKSDNGKDKDKDKDKLFSEKDLQNLIHDHPNILPISEIEFIFSGLVSLCKELGTGAGRVDNLFINSEGYITIVECKLFRNPQSRREVIGQILDYAKEFSKWSYEEFEEKILKARKNKNEDESLYSIVKSESDVKIPFAYCRRWNPRGGKRNFRFYAGVWALEFHHVND